MHTPSAPGLETKDSKAAFYHRQEQSDVIPQASVLVG